MDLSKTIIEIINNPIFAFVIGTILGAILTSLVSYIFSYIKDRYSSRNSMYLEISNNLSKKLYDCSQLACNVHIYQFKTALSCYNMSVSTARNIQMINSKSKFNTCDSSSTIHKAQIKLLEEKTKICDDITALHKSLIEIVLYFEANYIALNMFSEHRDEYFILSKNISEICDELMNILYFNEIIKWEENLDNSLLTIINEKIDAIEEKLSNTEVNILAYISDFQVGLQNEFFSKYFRKNLFQKYNLNYRKPLKGKVIKPKKSKKRNLVLYK